MSLASFYFSCLPAVIMAHAFALRSLHVRTIRVLGLRRTASPSAIPIFLQFINESVRHIIFFEHVLIADPSPALLSSAPAFHRFLGCTSAFLKLRDARNSWLASDEMEFLIYPASTFASGFALTDHFECSCPRQEEALLSTFLPHC